MGKSKKQGGQGPRQQPSQAGQPLGYRLTRKMRPSTPVSADTQRPGRAPVFAHMEMPKIKVKVNDQLASKTLKTADSLWPNQGQRAVNRLARDAILRYLRYSGDGTQHRP